ncbi:MAG: TRAP transporter substrate-binding protein DctP, partial [Polyangiales bacterium]
MTKTGSSFIFFLAASAFLLPGAVSAPQASADGPVIIRFASLAPAGSGFMKISKAWNRSVKKETNNRVEIRFYSGGSQGDERDFVRKMRA